MKQFLTIFLVKTWFLDSSKICAALTPSRVLNSGGKNYKVPGGYILVPGGYIPVPGGYIPVPVSYIPVPGSYIPVPGGCIRVPGGFISVFL